MIKHTRDRWGQVIDLKKQLTPVPMIFGFAHKMHTMFE